MDSSMKNKAVSKMEPASTKVGSSIDMTSKDKPKSSPDKMQDKNSTIKKPVPK